MSLLANSNAIEDAGYNIQRSLRFRSSASAYLSRTFTTPTNNLIWTWSGWVKRGTLGTAQQLMGTGTLGTGADQAGIQIGSDNTLYLYQTQTGTGSYEFIVQTTQVLRDPSAWYHIFFVYDSTQATSSNRIKLYINGVQVTAFTTATYPSLNLASRINAARSHDLGRYGSGVNYFDGYMTEVNFIDGQALTPSSFGQTDPVTGVWQPKKYTGTYGTNGFYLPFSDNTSATTLAYDKSGNGNNWTPNNISTTAGATYDSMLDVPTLYADGGNGRGNYCTWNPISNTAGGNVTFSNANLQASIVSSSGGRGITATQEMRSGKWYAEFVVSSWGTSNNADIGILRSDTTVMTTSSFALVGAIGSYLANGYSISQGGNVYSNGSSLATGLTSYSTTDVVQVAFDADNGKLYFGKNGTWLNSANPSAGTGGFSVTTGYGYLFAFGGSSNTAQTETATANFGQRPFAYTPPTGYKALNTQNLPTPTISNGATVMAATLWTGNGTSQSISNAVNGISFQPDMVWVKDRSAARSHVLIDAVRGTGLTLFPNETTADQSNTDRITSFNSNGFSVGAGLGTNANTETYVGWQWNAGGSTVTNTSGTISAQVRANATAGFSVVTYTGNGSSGATVGHGLGVAPAFIIIKDRTAARTGDQWPTYHVSIGATGGLVYLNSTGAGIAASTVWNNTNPSSSVFTLGNWGGINYSGDAFVAYCFTAIPGFSKFGSYTGNGSTDGPFVYCGFRPKYVLIKSSSAAGTWTVWDSARNVANSTNMTLAPNNSAAENNVINIDFTSNGFKVRHVGDINASGVTSIYAAFAESPFKTSLAR